MIEVAKRIVFIEENERKNVVAGDFGLKERKACLIR
jgi:hypothetical protein